MLNKSTQVSEGLGVVQYEHAEPRLYVYYHCFLIAGWQELVLEQMARLRRCGLYAVADRLVIGLIGSPYDISTAMGLLQDGNKVVFLRESPWDHAEEFKTISRLHHDAVNQEYDFAWYCHTKGITHSTEPGISYARDWRLLMEYYLLDRWQDALWSLEHGHDLYGANWRGPSVGTPWHFSGNFFVARRDYLTRLPAPVFTDRYSNEFWVGQASPRVCCPHESGVIHNQSFYPETRYRGCG
jgi:hypothetical protein